MKVIFERVDNETPMRIGMTDALGGNNPSFALNPTLGYNKFSKASAKGFIFVERGVAVEFTCRFMAFVIKKWPDTLKTFKELIDGVARSAMLGEMQKSSDSGVINEDR
jgi:hypothetical protein